jgi:hypothetical protein
MKTANVPPDRSKIILDSENQVRHWTKHLGVTQQELARAIERVGNSAATVRKQLATSKVASQSNKKFAATTGVSKSNTHTECSE